MRAANQLICGYRARGGAAHADQQAFSFASAAALMGSLSGRDKDKRGVNLK